MNPKTYKYRQCPKCKEIFELTEAKCLKCGYDLTKEPIQNTAFDIEKDSSGTEKSHFKTLREYAKYYAGFGWVTIVLGVIIIIYGSSGHAGEVGFIAIIGGLVLGIIGFSMVPQLFDRVEIRGIPR